MMMSERTSGGFQKIKKLITVLRKCNGKSVIGSSDALISAKAARILMYGGLLALACALFAGVYFLQPYIDGIIGIRSLTQAIMLIMLIISLIIAVKDTVTVLYTSDDLELLLPMPFSAVQIVMAKLAVVAVFPITCSLIVMNAVCLGYGVRAGAGAPFIIGTVLSSVLIPVAGISAAALLAVIVFRLFGFIRNRDITVAVGGIFTFALTIAYVFFSNRIGGDGSGRAQAALGVLTSVSNAFPNISFMNRFMFEGSAAGLIISLLVPLVLIVLTALAVRAFYFDTALSMQKTGAGRKAVSKAMLNGGKKRGALRALTGYEAASARRNPAYMIYGFVISFLWPLLMILPLLLRNNRMLTEVTAPLGTVQTLLAVMSFAATASCFSCGFNILPGTAFSREGASFSAICSLPVDIADYVRSKRSFSMLICSCGSVLYVAIAGAAAVFTGFISVRNIWMILAGACVSYALNLIFIDLMLLKNSKKPQLNWDSETELSRKLGVINLIVIVVGVVMLMVFMVSLGLGKVLSSPSAARIVIIVCAAAGAAILCLTLVINRYAVRAAADNLMNLEL